MGEHCTPHANFERPKKLIKRPTAQEDSAPSSIMTNAPHDKQRKRIVPGGNAATKKVSVADDIKKPTQAQSSATSSEQHIDGFRETHSTGNLSDRSLFAGHFVETNSKSPARRLLPVTHKRAVVKSYAWPAIFTGQILLEEGSQDQPHKVQVFSSQKTPQPFLDR